MARMICPICNAQHTLEQSGSRSIETCREIVGNLKTQLTTGRLKKFESDPETKLLNNALSNRIKMFEQYYYNWKESNKGN